MEKALKFVGASRDEVSAFSTEAKREAGFELFRVQEGEEPKHWRSMADIGPGVRELKITAPDGQYRVMYVASLRFAVYVLHGFQKKTHKTPKSAIELAKRRYREAKENDEARRDH